MRVIQKTRRASSPVLGALVAAIGTMAIALPAGAAELRFEHVASIGTVGTGEGQFKYIEDFAFTKDGRLLATDAAHAYVQVFDATTGQYLARFGGKGDGDEYLEKPEGIAVDPDGNIFVADYSTGDVKKYDKNFQWIKTFSEYGSAPGQNQKSEFLDIYDGKLYLPEAGNHRVDVFSLDGDFLFLFGGLGAEPGQMNNPEAAKVNSRGEVFVSDLKNDRIQVFDAAGKYLRMFGKSGSGPGELKVPAGLAIDAKDNVYVAEIGNDRVQIFDRDGNYLAMFGTRGTGNGEFGNLHGIIVNKKTGWVYVADTANNRIQVFKPVN